jgi:hypothetical protein
MSEPSPSPPLSDSAILLKALHHMLAKGRPVFKDGKPIGYRVPVREFKRVRSKYYKLSSQASKDSAGRGEA